MSTDQSLTRAEARTKILRAHTSEYLPEIGGRQNRDPILGPVMFYGWLQNYYPELLDFPDSGDRYQTITCWVIESEYPGTH